MTDVRLGSLEGRRTELRRLWKEERSFDPALWDALANDYRRSGRRIVGDRLENEAWMIGNLVERGSK